MGDFNFLIVYRILRIDIIDVDSNTFGEVITNKR